MKYAKDVTQLIGKTPLVLLNNASKQTNATILGKCEFLNPSHSVKDRAAYGMIAKALQDKLINENTTIIEPTSGNTGIALAMICATFNLKLILTMPSSMSLERRKILLAFGAKLILTDPALGMSGAVDEAKNIQLKTPNSFIPQQFENLANKQAHINSTAVEILNDTDGKVDIFVASVGTGGTLSGVGEVLKQHNPNIKIIAVEPDLSPVLSGGKAGAHKIQGIGAGFIPKVLNTKIYDDIIKVSNEDAFLTAKNLTLNEGLFVGISAGANVYAATKIAKTNKAKTIVTILCDTGERYLSTTLYD